MTRVYALTNHKGGVGKSTSATNIALGISAMLKNAGASNSRVLLIDTDSQAHATLITTGRNDFDESNSLYTVLMADCQKATQVLSDCLVQSHWDANLHVLPASSLKVKEASNFLSYVYDDLGCTSLITGYPLDMGTTTKASVSLDKGPYCWKVQAVGVDAGIPDVFSIFTVSPPALPDPILLSPANKELTNDSTPLLDWEDVLDAVEYVVEWSTDKKFRSDVQSTVANASSSDVTLPALPNTEGKSYYWRVAAMSDLGVEGKWSKASVFTLDTVPPDVPILSLPTDGETINNSSPRFSWSKISK